MCVYRVSLQFAVESKCKLQQWPSFCFSLWRFKWLFFMFIMSSSIWLQLISVSCKEVNKLVNQKEIYESQVSLLRLGSSVCLAVVTNNSAVNQPTWLLLVCFLLKVVCAFCTSVRACIILLLVAVPVRGAPRVCTVVCIFLLLLWMCLA